MQKWENTEIILIYESGSVYWANNPAYAISLTERLNLCGNDGWELAATYVTANEQQTQVHYCHKRPYG